MGNGQKLLFLIILQAAKTQDRPKASTKIAITLLCNYNVVMSKMNFQWDSFKAESNQKKHGVSFEEAISVFYDDFARLIPDPDGSIGEERFIILGKSNTPTLLVVCHCYRDDDNIIRVISARRADKRERNLYERYCHA